MAKNPRAKDPSAKGQRLETKGIIGTAAMPEKLEVIITSNGKAV
jgi:hypothetical protein